MTEAQKRVLLVTPSFLDIRAWGTTLTELGFEAVTIADLEQFEGQTDPCRAIIIDSAVAEWANITARANETHTPVVLISADRKLLDKIREPAAGSEGVGSWTTIDRYGAEPGSILSFRHVIDTFHAPVANRPGERLEALRMLGLA